MVQTTWITVFSLLRGGMRFTKEVSTILRMAVFMWKKIILEDYLPGQVEVCLYLCLAIDIYILQDRILNVSICQKKSIDGQGTDRPASYITICALKGKFDVSRTDKFTFVAATEGNVSIPEQKSLWWDSSSEKVMTSTIPAMHFTIIVDPQIALDVKSAKEKKFVLYVAMIGFILLFLYRFFTPVIKARRKEEALTFEASEEGKYAKLQTSVKNGDISAMYRHFYDWIGIIIKYDKPQTIRDIYEQYPQFKDACQMFEAALLYPDKLKQRKCLKTLEVLREILLEIEQKSAFALEKHLNP